MVPGAYEYGGQMLMGPFMMQHPFYQQQAQQAGAQAGWSGSGGMMGGGHAQGGWYGGRGGMGIGGMSAYPQQYSAPGYYGPRGAGDARCEMHAVAGCASAACAAAPWSPRCGGTAVGIPAACLSRMLGMLCCMEGG
jgi:hypothetical protein